MLELAEIDFTHSAISCPNAANVCVYVPGYVIEMYYVFSIMPVPNETESVEGSSEGKAAETCKLCIAK